jgi:hypothetical protein
MAISEGVDFLSKKISREQFVKISAIVLTSAAGVYFLNKFNLNRQGRGNKNNSYGNGTYGGR